MSSRLHAADWHFTATTARCTYTCGTPIMPSFPAPRPLMLALALLVGAAQGVKWTATIWTHTAPYRMQQWEVSSRSRLSGHASAWLMLMGGAVYSPAARLW